MLAAFVTEGIQIVDLRRVDETNIFPENDITGAFWWIQHHTPSKKEVQSTSMTSNKMA